MRALALAVALSFAPGAAMAADDGVVSSVLRGFKFRSDVGFGNARDLATACVLAAVLAGNGPPTRPPVVADWCVEASLQVFKMMTPPPHDSKPEPIDAAKRQ